MSYAIAQNSPQSSPIDGLWVLLVPEGNEKVPMVARSANGIFLLAFRTGHGARKFMSDSSIDGAEPRMVLAASAPRVLDLATGRGASAVLVDYDAATQNYRSAVALA